MCLHSYCSLQQDANATVCDAVRVHTPPAGSRKLLLTRAGAGQPHATPPRPPPALTALDAGAAGRVADYVLRRAAGGSGGQGAEAAGGGGGKEGCDAAAPAACAQFIIVSHRPQVFERAGCLLGVYGAAHGGSEAVAHWF